MPFKKGCVADKQADTTKMKIVGKAWGQVQGFIDYANGIIKRDGYEAIFNDSHEKHAPWKKAVVTKSLDYCKDLSVKSMPTEVVGENGGPVRLIIRAASDTVK